MKALMSAVVIGLIAVAGCDGGDGCIVQGTLVDTPVGPVAIEAIRAGDAIVCVDPITRKETLGRVRAVRSLLAGKHLVVSTSDGSRVGVTQHHPFWDPDAQEFREIGEFAAGDELQTWRNGTSGRTRIESIDVVRGPVMVYHPEVDRVPHTFVANGLIVHNKPPTLPDPVRVTLRVEPDGSGWISFPGGFVGQGADTVFFLQEQSSPRLEAVPRVGWAFDHWEGDVSATDTFVVYMDVRDGSRAVCFFAPQP